MTDEKVLAALGEALPCEDPEEPCDADGRDAHRWCDNCIARSVVARSGWTLVRQEAAEQARLVSQWHGSIGSGPLAVLDAELRSLARVLRGDDR